MANINNLTTVGNIYLAEVDADPTLATTKLPNGDSVPIGSIVFLDNGGVGQAFLKTGVSDTAYKRLDLSDNDWCLVGNLLTGASATTPNEYVGSNNDYDVVFKRNLIEAMRIQNGGFGPGLVFGSGSNTLGEFLRRNMTATRQIASVVQAYNASGKTMLIQDISASIQTTNAATTPIYNFTTATDTAILMKIFVLCRASAGGSVGNVATYTRTVTARNVAGVVTVRQTNSDQSSEDDANLNLSVTSVGAVISVNALGIASRTFDWLLSGQVMTTT